MVGETTKSATGFLSVEERRTDRVWIASVRFGDGQRARRTLGLAWAKPNGTTSRGSARWRAPGGSKPGPSYLTPKEAEVALAELLASLPPQEAAPGRYVRRRMTFGLAVDEWLRHREEEKGVKPTTLRSYRNDADRYLISYFGRDRALATITTRDVDGLKTHLHAKGLSPRTVQKAMVEVHGVLARAKRIGWITSNPAVDAERVTVKRKRDLRVLEPEQVFAVARALRRSHPDTWMASLAVFAAFSGLRLGECRAIRWQDIDFANGAIRVRRSQSEGFQEGTPKSGAVRAVPLIPQTAEVLAKLGGREFYVGPSDRLFPSTTGAGFAGGEVRTALYDALAAVGLGYLREGETPFRFHDLRHTFGTLGARVFALRDLQAYMGHESVTTTEIYLHHVPQNDAAQKLGALVSRAMDPLGLGGHEQTQMT
ncbi:MAG: site-specific integrase [Solirubrobacterales bacterium]|nr:site-specific integrase [Solirubrobacterales bacterium]